MSRVHLHEPLRRQVVERASGRCEYCLLHQDDVPFSHQVDHIVPLKHGGRTISENLAVACLECNRHKGSDLTAIDPEDGEISSLFSPRLQNWDEHFAVDDARIVGRTATGRATASLLRMNERKRVAERRALIDAGRWPPTSST
ncbi:MAG: HNH endonuclease [Chloroflexi bacterium]|nr:HNH endonuclease [Chloroflexota bacterium]